MDAASDVAVDDADDNDDGHARDDGRGKDQPAVLERSRHHMSEEDWTRVNRVVRVAWAAPGRRAVRTRCRNRRQSRRLNASARRRQRRPLG